MNKFFACWAFIFLYGCSYYPVNAGDPHPMPVEEHLKCIDTKMHHLPSCYCNKFVVQANPERENVCTAAANSPLKKSENRLISEKDWLFNFRKQTVMLEKYKPDTVELWSDNTLDYLLGNKILDDCDGLGSILDVLFLVGGFQLSELTKILVEIDGTTSKKYHFVVAVWSSNDWLVLDQAKETPVSLVDISSGKWSYGEEGGPTYNILAHRRLDQKVWKKGLPSVVDTTSQGLNINI